MWLYRLLLLPTTTTTTTSDLGAEDHLLVAVRNTLAEAAALLRAEAPATTTALLDSETTVTDLGCWREGWPTALRPLGSLAAGWRTVSPLSCACLCRTKHGSKWTGIVGLGYEHIYSTCSCGVTGQLGFAHTAPAHTARGRADDACCPRYDALRGIVGTPPLVRPLGSMSGGHHPRLPGMNQPLRPGQLGYPSAKISCPCLIDTQGRKSCEAERRAGISDEFREHLHGNSPDSKWVNKVFRVDLGSHCSQESCPRAPPRALTWEAFAMCPVPSGFEEEGQQCALKRGTKPYRSTIRIGSRTPTPQGEAASIIQGEVMMVKSDGVACDAQLLLQLLPGGGKAAPLSLTMAAARSYEMHWAAHLGNRSLMTGWPFPAEFTRAQSAAQIRASLDFICSHPDVVSLDALTCWRKRGPEDTPGGEDCRVREFEKEKWRSAAAVVTLSTARRRQEELIAPLGTEILRTFSRGRSCPDVDGMAAELHPLLEANVAALQRMGDDNTNAEQKTGVAFVIPFRARPVELRKWLRWMIPTLLRESAPPFSVFVAELVPGQMWNKARLNNAAVREIETRFPRRFGCFIFADVDLVLQAPGEVLRKNACALTCDPHTPTHYSTTLLGYNQPYSKGLVAGVFGGSGPPEYRGGQSSGGVVGLTIEQFANVNGWPNSVWGWGSEDGLLDLRIKGKYGKMMSPIEWGAMAGNEKCIWLHMQDDELAVKGAAHVQDGLVESTFQHDRLYEHGYREIDPLYDLVEMKAQELYTTLRFSLHGN